MIRKAYKFKLKPTDKQAGKLHDFAGHARFVWNKVLKWNLDRLSKKQALIWCHEADYFTKLWKKSDEFGFLSELPAQCIQQKLKDLDKAFRNAFDKKQPLKRIPRTKKRNVDDSFRFPEPKQIQFDNRRIKLPKLGWIGFYKSQSILGTIRNVTVSRKAGDWYIAVQVDLSPPETRNEASKALGIDLGIKKFIARSDGKEVQSSPRSYRRFEKALSSAQRKLSKKLKFSHNWKKQQQKIQRIHQKIAHCRRDFQHKLSTKLCKNHAMIVVEALKISNMSRSARGTLETPGKQVKSKSGLNKSILDQGWGEFKRQLQYKLNWLGGLYLEVSPAYTSQKCSACGYTEKKNRQSQSIFCCQSCGFEENADENAAKNILAAGHAVLACGEIGLPNSMKQEPLRTGNLVSV